MKSTWNNSRRSGRRFSHPFLPIIIAVAFTLLPRSMRDSLQEWISSAVWKSRYIIQGEASSPPGENNVALEMKEDIHIQEMLALAHWENELKVKSEEESSISLQSISALPTPLPHISLCTAKVIFQENAPYGTALWIDIGKKRLRAFSSSYIDPNSPYPIEKNCPVVCEGYVVGCIDYVGEYASRVSLISDPKITIAVRVQRSPSALYEAIYAGRTFERALQRYTRSKSTPSPTLEKGLKAIHAVVQTLQVSSSQTMPLLLARGQLRGAKKMSEQSILEGIGFTCDFETKDSPKRDLRTGQTSLYDEKIAIVRPGDLLETTGLDGVFPQGLLVASVTSVQPLVEGATSYTIEAKSLAPHFPSLSYVSVLPRLPEEIQNPPSAVERILSLIDEEGENDEAHRSDAP